MLPGLSEVLESRMESPMESRMPHLPGWCVARGMLAPVPPRRSRVRYRHDCSNTSCGESSQAIRVPVPIVGRPQAATPWQLTGHRSAIVAPETLGGCLIAAVFNV